MWVQSRAKKIPKILGKKNYFEPIRYLIKVTQQKENITLIVYE